MLFGLNESTIDTNVSVEALVVPKHLEESVLGISAYGQAQAEKIYEAALELHGKYVTTLQRGISEGKLSESVDVILQEGALSNFFNRVKEFFKKIWATIKGMFEKFMAWLDSKMKSDKDFIAKYKKVLLQKSAKVSDMQYKGHEWGIVAIPDTAASVISKGAQATAEEIAAAKKDYESALQNIKGGKPTTSEKKDIQDKYKAYQDMKNNTSVNADGSDREAQIESAIGELAKLMGITTNDADELVVEYKEKCYGGEADVMTGPNVSELMKIVEGYDKDKSSSEKLFKSLNKEFDSAIKNYEKMEKEELKKTPTDMKFSTLIDMTKAQATALNKLTSVYLQAIKDRRDESKAVLAKVITYKGE